MTLPVYPGREFLRGLTYGQKWSPAFFNQSATTATGADVDVGIAQYPLHDFELDYEYLRDGLYSEWLRGEGLEFKTLMGFWLQSGGTKGRFLYKNTADFKVNQNQIGVGDSSTTVFPLTRTYGANGFFQTEPVGQVIPGEPFNAYLNGSPSPVLPAAYELDTTSPLLNTITFNTAPSGGQAITVDMSYYYYCKFPKDTNTFEKFMDKLWNATVQIHSCRPGA